GGSLIDFETGNFKKHSSDKWNRQVDILAEEGHISKKQAQVEKIIPQETTESSPTF
ncbi:TPA: type II/IV secretion system protein, partial [Streptococcus agalactiae]